MNQNHRSKTRKHKEHSILSTNLLQNINYSVKHNNLVIIIIQEELKYNKHLKVNSNLTIYRANLVNLVQNTKNIQKITHNMESKIPQII